MKRIPRPKGYTELAQTYNNKGNVTKDQLDNHIIQHYIATGFSYLGQPMDIPTLSQLTQIDEQHITQQVLAYGQTTMAMADPNESGDILRALSGLLISGALGDRQRALKQYQIMALSQGESYKPFISAEVTKALKLTMESNAGLLDLLKALSGSGGTTIVNNLHQSNNAQTNNYLTSEGALELIQQNSNKAPLLEDPEAKEALRLEYKIDELPEVNATRQTGLDTTKEALNLNKIAKVSDGLLSDEPESQGHIDRRAQELEVDLDEDEV